MQSYNDYIELGCFRSIVEPISQLDKSVGTESRRSWVQIPLGPTSLTSKLSHEVLYNHCTTAYL